jgi:hypothetical protein
LSHVSRAWYIEHKKVDCRKKKLKIMGCTSTTLKFDWTQEKTCTEFLKKITKYMKDKVL